MARIRELVGQVLAIGYVDLEAEEQLRQLLAAKYDADDLRAFMRLQLAAMNGEVRLESHERQRESLSIHMKSVGIVLA